MDNSCPNIYCPDQSGNVDHEEGDYGPDTCTNYIGIPIACDVRDKYIKDHCPTESEYGEYEDIKKCGDHIRKNIKL